MESLDQSGNEQEEPHNIGKWREHIELASKTILILFGISYFAGLFILNLYIKSYGIHYLGFLQVEYVMVGGLWLFLTGLMYCFVSEAAAQVQAIKVGEAKTQEGEQRQKPKTGTVIKVTIIRLVGLLVLMVIGIPLFNLVIGYVSDGKELIFTISYWKIIFALGMSASWVGIFGRGLYVAYLTFVHKKKFEKVIPIPLKRGIYFDAMWNGLLLIGALSFYSKYAYPEFSPAFGGGRKQKVEFIIKADQISTMAALGLQVASDSRSTGTVEVIFEAPDFFAITPPQDFGNKQVKAIRIKKDIVDAALYLKDK